MPGTVLQIAHFKVKQEFVQEFENALRGIFEALRKQSPRGIRYAVCRLPHCATYQGILELAAGVENPLPLLSEGKAFLDGSKCWLAEPPTRHESFVVGAYRFCKPVIMAPGRNCQ